MTIRLPDSLSQFSKDVSAKGTMSRSRQRAPGPAGLRPEGRGPGASLENAYSISGKPHDMGSMFLTVAQEKLGGTWYDRTDAIRAFRLSEAKLGMSEYADAEFRESAGRILSSLKNPPEVDADIRFKFDRGVETVDVSGSRGTRSYRFDRQGAENVLLAEGADVLKPFYDAIDDIIALIMRVR